MKGRVSSNNTTRTRQSLLNDTQELVNLLTEYQTCDGTISEARRLRLWQLASGYAAHHYMRRMKTMRLDGCGDIIKDLVIFLLALVRKYKDKSVPWVMRKFTFNIGRISMATTLSEAGIGIWKTDKEGNSSDVSAASLANIIVCFDDNLVREFFYRRNGKEVKNTRPRRKKSRERIYMLNAFLANSKNRNEAVYRFLQSQ